MSRRIFLDVEEALSREVRRITFHDYRTQDRIVLQDTYDPFTGEVVQAPIEADFYDSSADANHIQYPHFFIRLMKTREDLETGRVVPQYGKWITAPVKTSPGAYEIVVSGADGLITSAGDDITTTIFQIRKVLPGHLLRLQSGNNKGTYYVDSVTVSPTGDHTITVSHTLVMNMPEFNYNSTTGLLSFLSPLDLNTVKPGDNFIDSSSNSFAITAVDTNQSTFTLATGLTIDTSEGGSVYRAGDVFTATDLSSVRYLIMDPAKPIMAPGICGTGQQVTSQNSGVSPEIPIDAYYLIRIDSKTRENHIDILNRVWEEFNPPRTALPVIKRSSLSAEQSLTVDITTGGSNIVTVKDTSKFRPSDDVYIFDDYSPTKRVDGEGFQRPFQTKVVNILSDTQMELADVVPDTFKVQNCAKIVSNAELRLLMFHFVDHVTKDVEGSQYWVHEFTFWVQLWVDRLETPAEFEAIQQIETPIEDEEGNVII